MTAHQIRSTFADSLGHYPQIWLSIDIPNQSTNLLPKYDRNFYMIDYIFFGSLFSVEKFFVHDTLLNRRNNWKMKIYNKQALVIESEQENSSIRLSVPFKLLNKQILVIDGEDFAEIILSYNMIFIDIRTDTHRTNER